MKIPAAAIIVLLALGMASCTALLFVLSLTSCSEKEKTEIVAYTWEDLSFTTSVKRQLEKEGILKACKSAPKITVQLVWSDKAASDNSLIVEERIQTQSAPLDLNADQKKLLASIFDENTDYQESNASCLCIFQPQLRIIFFSKNNKTRHDILISGISHGEIQAFKNKKLMAYARCGHFIPAYLKFMDSVFPGHELTKMLHQHIETIAATKEPQNTQNEE